MEVPPPCNSLMTRGGGGEVKTRQVEPGGGEGGGGAGIFLSRSQEGFSHSIGRCEVHGAATPPSHSLEEAEGGAVDTNERLDIFIVGGAWLMERQTLGMR